MDNQGYSRDEILSLLRRLTRIETCCYNDGLPELIPTILDVKDLIERLALDERQRRVLELYFLQEYTQEEVAKEINTSQVTVSYIIGSIRREIERVVAND